jgi:hypothetical protein
MYLGHFEKLTRTRLDDLLIEEGVLDRAKVEEAQAEQERTGKQLGEILVAREMLPDYDLAKFVVTHYPLPFIDIAGFTTRREVVALLPADFCMRNGVLPLDQFGDTLTLAVCEVPSMELIEDIAARTKLMPSLFVGVRRAILETVDQASKTGAKAAAAKRATRLGVPTAAPAESAPESGTDAEDDESDLPLPDLVLPRVSMALVGGVPGVPKAPPPAPARPGVRSSIVARPPARPPQTAATTAAAPADPARPAVSKFGGAAAAEKPAAAAPSGNGKNGAWESIFDNGENAVKRDTAIGVKPKR